MNTKFSLAAAAGALLLVGAAALSGTDGLRAHAQENLPYAAVHHPKFISAAEATFLQPENRVIGVTMGKVAKAYPAAILAQHGLVEDQSPDWPFAVTW